MLESDRRNNWEADRLAVLASLRVGTTSARREATTRSSLECVGTECLLQINVRIRETTVV